MTDKDEIKFAIRYLKQGLKSKRTPPLYEELMKELGFEKKGKVIQELERENAELKLKLEALEGQTPWKDIKDKSELIKENAKLKEQNIKAKEIIRDFLSVTIDYIDKEDKNYSFIGEAEQFLKENK